MIAWFALLGLSASFSPVLTAHGRTLFSPDVVGRGLTLVNLGTMAGVFLMQAVTGAVVGMFEASDGVYPLTAYQAAFAVEAVLVAGALSLYVLRATDPVAQMAASLEGHTAA